MAGYDGSIRIDTKIDSTGFNKGVRGMADNFGKLMRSVGLAFGALAIINFGKNAVQAASDLTDAMTGLNSVVSGTGGNFSNAKKFIMEYISDGLVPATDAITAYKNLALRGYSTGQIEQTMLRLKDAAAFGRQGSLTMGAAVRSATEGLKNENSILVDNAGVTKNVSKMWKDYGDKIGVAVQNLTKEQKIAAEVAGIQEETRFQVGDAARATETFSGRVSALGTSFFNLKVALGNAIIPVLGAIIPYIKAVIDWLTGLFTIFAQFMSALFGISLAMEDIAAASDEAADGTGQMSDNTSKAGKAAKGALAAFDELNVLQQDRNGGGGGAGGGGGGLPELPEIPSSEEIGEELDNMLEKATAFKESMIRLFTPVIEALGRLYNALLPLGQTLWEGLKWAWDNILVPFATWTITEVIPEFIDMLANAATILNNALVALQPLGMWLWDNFLKPLAEWTGGVIISVLESLNGMLKDLGDWIAANPENFRTIATVIALVVAAFATANLIIGIWTGLAGVAAAVTAAFGAAVTFLSSPVVLITLAILALVGIVYLLITYWPQISEAAGKAWEWIQQTWATVAEWFNLNVVQPLKEWFSELWENLKTWASGAWTKIQEVWGGVVLWFNTNVVDPLKTFFSNLWKQLSDEASNTWDSIVLVWSKVYTWFTTNVITPLRNGFNNALQAINTFFSTAWTSISTLWTGVCLWFTTNVITPLRTAFDTALLAISGFFTTAWNVVSTAWTGANLWFSTSVVTPIKNAFDTALLAVSGFFSTAWTTILTTWETASAWFQTSVITPIRDAFNTMLTGSADGTGSGGLIGTFGSAFGGIVDVIKGSLNIVISGINTLISGAVQGINLLIDSINNFGQYIPGFTRISHLTAPQIPLLANGAVIPANSQFLAVLGDQKNGRNLEAPEALIRQIIREEVGSGNSNGQDIRIGFEGDLGALVRELMPYIRQENARTGNSLAKAVV